MHLTCACGIHGSIELFTSDEHARRFSAIVDKLPAPVRTVTPNYIGLFRAKHRRIAWERACRLLDELRAMIEAGCVERRGRQFPAAPVLFAAAMQQMLDGRDRLELPLANHNYLVAIVAGDSPRAASAAEAANEELKRVASSQRTGSRSQAIAELSSEIARRKRFKEPEMTDTEKQQFITRLDGGES